MAFELSAYDVDLYTRGERSTKDFCNLYKVSRRTVQRGLNNSSFFRSLKGEPCLSRKWDKVS